MLMQRTLRVGRDATKIFIEVRHGLFTFLMVSESNLVTFLPMLSYFYDFFLILGFMKRDPNFGVVPKTVLSALLGHIYGRLSYIGECDQKLREKLPPSSHLGQTMRKYFNEHNPPPKK